MQRPAFFIAIAFTSILPLSGIAQAEERLVSTPDELSTALEAAQPGDEIVLRPGTYNGGLYRENLKKVTIRSEDVKKPAVIEGGGFGLMLSDPVDVVLANLVFQNQEDNGINIDDAGSPETPARNITLIGVTVRDMQNAGNHDAIKMAGVKDFVVDGVRVENWGTGGSAIDFVGCHRGLVQNSVLKHDNLEVGGSAIRPKGGSKDIVIRANRIELPNGMGRGIQAGGRTDAEYFRFPDGEDGYEASEIVVEGNVVIGTQAAFTWVNIDGGVFHHNVAHRPGQWVMRILNENEDTGLVPSRNGRFLNNDIVFNDTEDEFNRAVNEGDAVEPQTFQFARNRWYNLANPKASRPKLPAEETDGVYGQKPLPDTDAPQVWTFPWGKWIVNANPDWKSVEIEGYETLQAAVPGKDSKFEPLQENPLTGEWSALDLKGATAKLQPMSQLILIDRDACAGCAGN
jgi:hypothetical protein